MKFKILQATKDLFGIWQVETAINGHKYIYNVNDHDYNKAMQLYRKGGYGRALNILKEGEYK